MKNKYPLVSYEYEEPEPHLGWGYRIDWSNGNTSFSHGYATKEEAEADAQETLQLDVITAMMGG